MKTGLPIISKPLPCRATDPANAILNYLYAILEAEARIAALRMGLDPGLGFLHVDQVSRDSLACDLMEVVRPKVDAHVLDLLQKRTFKKADFFETREGVCRLMPPLTHELAATGRIWAKEFGPVTERATTVCDNQKQQQPKEPIRGIDTAKTSTSDSAYRKQSQRWQGAVQKQAADDARRDQDLAVSMIE